MSIFGVTKGTEFESEIEKHRKGEEQGATLYTALALLAKEKGLDEVSEALIKLATDEARHAGLYAVLNGQVNQDIFDILEKAAVVESKAVKGIYEFADRVRKLGLEDAAIEIEKAAKDEGKHGEILKELVDRFKR